MVARREDAEAERRENLVDLADGVKSFLPDGTPFVLIVCGGEDHGRSRYISNAQPAGVLAMMRQAVAGLEARQRPRRRSRP